MTLLSLTASFGALVWIFQDGNLRGVARLHAARLHHRRQPDHHVRGHRGLSMDYEVLLLSRIQESYRRTGDNTASVAEGLARTAGVITGAAMIMVVVFAAFTPPTSSPSRASAWAWPSPSSSTRRSFASSSYRRRCACWVAGTGGRRARLGRFAEKLGFSHVEDEDVGEPLADAEASKSPAPAHG